MAQYRKGSEIVDAIQFDPHQHPWPPNVVSWSTEQVRPRDMSWGYIQTKSGREHIMAGDWIVTNAASELALVKDALFGTIYQPIDESSGNVAPSGTTLFLDELRGMIAEEIAKAEPRIVQQVIEEIAHQTKRKAAKG